ncbi:MAG: hypothetical protein EOO27_30165 [Comamonadaceae bacterium]|nr:MAG: hypothetical protein EOO27_30165 [Comamonadaceae bacterium]
MHDSADDQLGVSPGSKYRMGFCVLDDEIETLTAQIESARGARGHARHTQDRELSADLRG